tara:strand:+ start:1277 stop:1477 length:201 start_codon:yes stop_codon:yes gene_type:complete
MSIIGRITKYKRITSTRITNRFNLKPALAIWGIERCPLARTHALGPVPEGSINAQDAAMVAGIINK